MIFKAGTTLDDIVVTMTEIASQTRGPTVVDIGDSFTYELVIDLSGIAIGQKSDLAIEIFAMDATNGFVQIKYKFQGH